MKFNKELLLIPVLVLLLVLTIAGLKTYYPVLDITATGMTTSGLLELCVNHPPIPDFSNCQNETDVNVLYTCDVNVTDNDVNYTFTDNTTLFDINRSTGVFSFIPTEIKTYQFNITANDGSVCLNNEYSRTFNVSAGNPVIKKEEAEKESRGHRHARNSGRDGDNLIQRDIDLRSEISVLMRGENRTHVILKLFNNATIPLRNLTFETYSPDGINITLNKESLELLEPLEELELNLEFDSETKSGNYDIFIFIEAEDDFNKHFMINVDLENGTAELKDSVEFRSKKMGDLEFEYSLSEWIILVFIGSLLFLLITKLIHM